MEDLKDLLFDLTVDGFMDPSVSFEDMEDLILEDNVDDSKEIEEIFFDGIEPVSKLDILADCIVSDEESDKETEKTVAINSNKNDN